MVFPCLLRWLSHCSDGVQRARKQRCRRGYRVEAGSALAPSSPRACSATRRSPAGSRRISTATRFSGLDRSRERPNLVRPQCDSVKVSPSATKKDSSTGVSVEGNDTSEIHWGTSSVRAKGSRRGRAPFEARAGVVTLGRMPVHLLVCRVAISSALLAGKAVG